jgi:transketolase
MKFAFIEALSAAAADDPAIVLLTGDLGFQIFDRFAERFGPRFVNVGVAEAQMTLAAAGMAHVGLRPVTYSIASFATARCFEQIKLAVAYEGLPVTIVGAGGGYAYSHSGVTHHAGEDLALMAALPGMTVVAPGDCREVAALLPQVMKLDGPCYFRIGRGKEPDVACDEPAVLGKARLLQTGQKVAVVSCGEALGELAAALALLAAEGIRPLAYQMHTVKPLDTPLLDRIAATVDTVVVVEEHVTSGGLADAVARWAARRPGGPVVAAVSVGDAFVLGSPHTTEFRAAYGLDAAGIAAAVRSAFASGRNAGP